MIPKFTGEFMVPGLTPIETYLEHKARYEFACAYVPGKRVLDSACGTGYGSAMLHSGGAMRVIGIDRSPDAIGYAREHYTGSGIRFSRADVTRLPFPAASFDMVVSFETIEHLPEPDGFLRECHRVLRPGGILVGSTPNKRVYSIGLSRPINPYHEREFTIRQFRRLLSPIFGESIRLFAQRSMSLRRRVVYELCSLDRRFPVLAPLLRRLHAADEPPRQATEGPLSHHVDCDSEYAVGPLRSSWRRPATFLIAVCERR